MIDTKTDIQELLYEICDDETVYKEDVDLIDSGLLDSLAFIELFSRLEDSGIVIQPTRINRNQLRTVDGIKKMIDDHLKKSDS